MGEGPSLGIDPACFPNVKEPWDVKAEDLFGFSCTKLASHGKVSSGQVGQEFLIGAFRNVGFQGLGIGWIPNGRVDKKTRCGRRKSKGNSVCILYDTSRRAEGDMRTILCFRLRNGPRIGLKMQSVQAEKKDEEAQKQKNPVKSRESPHDTSLVLSGEF